MNAYTYETLKDQLKLNYEIDLLKLELRSQRSILTSYDNYDEEDETVIKMKKRIQLKIEELKIKLRILLFDLECLKEENVDIV